ncbi:MAG: efflux RND transporter permease subunit [Ignavibacteriae bacterium]|nr:efflux RND transporter permease subunit [Ignavibacteriota bacterium]
MTITELAIKRPSLVVVFFSVLGVLGIFGYTQLKYELLPKISPPIITIATIYPGASPSEVETSVSKPIEDAVSGIDKVSAVRSTSAEGRSIVTVEMQQGASVDLAVQDAQRRVNGAQQLLPKDARAPIISKIALDEIPVVRMGVTSNMPSREFYQFIKDHVQPEFAKLNGVGLITLVGGEEREIKVNLDPMKIRSYGLGINQITQLIKASNVDFPTGNIKEAENQFVVRVAGKFNSVDELRSLVVGRSKQGGDIHLSDVAEVQDGHTDYTTITRLDGTTSVGILVSKQSDANSVEVSALVRRQIDLMKEAYKAKGLEFTIAQDGSLFTIEAADAVRHDLLIAILLVAAVMMLFLHSLRNSFIVMVAIPASLVSTLFVMYIAGFTLNLMTLLAMSLVIGILVDDSIVVLENIYRHLEKGQPKRVAALEGRNEIGFAALSITLVDVVVFVPLSLVSGIVGNILREFAVVVVVSTLFSLIVSFTITPVLASRFAKAEHLSKDTIMGRFGLWFEGLFNSLNRSYHRILAWSLKNWWTRSAVVVMTLVLLRSSFLLVQYGFVGFEFISQADRGEFTVTVELPPGAKVETTNYSTLQIEKILRDIPEVKKTFVNVGVSSEGLLGQTSNNSAEINVILTPKESRVLSTDEIGQLIKAKVQDMPGLKVRVNPIGIFGVANQTPIQIVVNGTTLKDVSKAANMIVDSLKSIKGAADVRLSLEDGKPETRVDIDRAKLAAFGLSIFDVGSSLKVALSGDDDAKFRDGDNEYILRILMDESDRSKTENLKSLTFVNNRGQQVELQQFANIYTASGPTKLQRENRNTAVTVFSQALGKPAGSIFAEFQVKLKNMKLPDGVTLTYQGDIKNQTEGFASLGIAFGAAILFVYLIMVALYDSYIDPFVVLFSIPVALIGSLLAMALNMKALGIFPILGIIMLIGLVAKNAILLVDRTNQMRKEEGLGIIEALLEAGGTRLRPILMTTLSMIIGMLPIALSASSGAEWKTGLAWALIGGLTSSLLLTLVLVPVIYILMEKISEFTKRIFRRIFPKSDDDEGIAIPSNATVVHSSEPQG